MKRDKALLEKITQWLAVSKHTKTEAEPEGGKWLSISQCHHLHHQIENLQKELHLEKNKKNSD